MKNYRIIEHTADLALCIHGKDLAALFRNAALALFEISVQKLPSVKPPKTESLLIKQQSDSVAELFIAWLNELLSLSAAKGLVFTAFKMNRVDEKSLEADVTAEDISGYKVNQEIKAATYHDLKVERSANGWQADVILDV